MGRVTASRETLRPDSRFNSLLVSKFINCLMYNGKKAVAQVAFYQAMDIIQEKMKDAEPIDVFHTAVENVKPEVEVRSPFAGCLLQPAKRKVAPCTRSWPKNSWQLTVAKVQPSPSATTFTAWPTPTRPSRTLLGKPVAMGLVSLSQWAW